MSDIDQSRNVQSARLALRAGTVNFRVNVQVTPTGLLSIGALVGTILVSTAALVWAAGSVRRRRSSGNLRRARLHAGESYSILARSAASSSSGPALLNFYSATG